MSFTGLSRVLLFFTINFCAKHQKTEHDVYTSQLHVAAVILATGLPLNWVPSTHHHTNADVCVQCPNSN